MEMGVIKLNRVTFLVLDEADRMLVNFLFLLFLSLGYGI